MTDTTDAPMLARTWEYREFMERGAETAADWTPDQQRARALANLRERIRQEGFVMTQESLIRDEGTPIVVDDPNTAAYHPWSGIGEPTHTLYVWTASATQPGTDTGDLAPLASEPDEDGRLWFAVPAEVSAQGGDVRLRHNLGGEVTVWGWNTSAAPFEPFTKSPYVNFAAGISDDVVTVTLLPGGTALLSVERDPEPDEDTDPRLLWMLRVLGAEFGGLGVLRTAAQMWPDAFEAAQARTAPPADEPAPPS